MDMDFNYLYITELGRYYFVRSKSLAQQRYYVNCEVDVLMSYNAQIKDLSVIADRSSSTFNLYQTDEEIPFLVKSDVATHPFPAGFTGQSLLITTAKAAAL
jgi:hypothetical protein